MPNSLERVYYADADYVLDNSSATNMARSIYWALKASLKKEILNTNTGPVTGWTCAGSSDGVTAGMDASDRWTSTYDTTKLVFASGAVAHSWIVLTHAGLGLWFTIDLNSATVEQAKLYISTTAPTGGSITARPTASGELSIVTTNNIFFTLGTGAAKAHRCFESNGYWSFLVSQNGAGCFHAIIAVVPLAETRSGDTNTWAVIQDMGTALNTSALLSTNIAATTSNPQWRNTSSHTRAYAVDGTTAVTLVPGFWAGINANIWYGQTLTGADSADGKYDDAPLYLLGISGSVTVKGRPYDWRQTAGVAFGSIFPAAGSGITHLCVGHTWIPWANAAPTL